MKSQEFSEYPLRYTALLLYPCFLVGWAFLSLAASAEDVAHSGKQIYADQCGRCHGEHGEGVKDEHPNPLWGDRSIVDLSKYISKSMPKDSPGDCTGPQAQAVAEYLHEAFYTELARARNRPPRIDLTRLTVRQYSESVADLIATFRGQSKWPMERGLEGEYRDKDNKSKRPGFNQIDTTIDIHLGLNSPDGENIGSGDYRVTWRGGLLAEQTGEYEFCVESTNGIRLYVNDTDKMLIDAWVKSGNATKHVGSLRLLGGRIYPIRLEMQKAAVEECNVMLSWKPPQKTWQLIPSYNLSPGGFPKLMIVETPFPADDSSFGYERGTSVSRAWDEATAYAAIEVAEKVAKELPRLVSGKEDDPERKTKVKDFCVRFVERAFRKSLGEDEKQLEIVDRLAGDRPESEQVQSILARTLVSPRFLYPAIDQAASVDFKVAASLAITLWDSIPDDRLWRAANEGRLHTDEQIRTEANRMVRDRRTKAKLRYFFEHWMHLERAADVSKDEERFPGFDRNVLADLRTSLDLFLDEVMESEECDFRQLLTSNSLYVNDRLAKFYEIDAGHAEGFRKVALDSSQRSGVVTHPYLMTAFAYHKSSSPIHRGVFLARNVLGRTLRAPPVAVAPLDESLDPNLTTRERVILQTKSEVCQTCHAMVNPLGFGLENFDAVGRFRSIEKEKSIDATGVYQATTGDEVRFSGPRELAEFLVSHPDTRRSFVIQLFHHFVQQPIYAYGPKQVDQLSDRFAQHEFNMRKLMVEIALVAANEKVESSK